MPESPSIVHHYVPRWYQKRFLSNGLKDLWYLDLNPELITNGAVQYRRNALKHWNPARCFCTDNLYSMQFGDIVTDALEKRFFGPVDQNGAAAAQLFADLDGFRDGMREGAIAPPR
jgi:hypothetical protein